MVSARLRYERERLTRVAVVLKREEEKVGRAYAGCVHAGGRAEAAGVAKEEREREREREKREKVSDVKRKVRFFAADFSGVGKGRELECRIVEGGARLAPPTKR